jgi:hypothetical protein
MNGPIAVLRPHYHDFANVGISSDKSLVAMVCSDAEYTLKEALRLDASFQFRHRLVLLHEERERAMD